ncbi:methyl-accepting chemotaxis protein [Thalassotalea ganghwensis]
MGFIQQSLVRQLLFGVIIALLAISTISAFIQISKVKQQTQSATDNEVNRILLQLSDKLTQLLTSRNNQLDAIFTHPGTLAGVESIQVRGLQPSELPEWKKTTDYFNQVMKLDPTVVEVFITTTSTWEYFSSKGKNSDPDYYINKRPFWQEFLSQMNHYVNDPYRDQDGNILMTFRTPLFNEQGKLIGTGGLDLNLEQVNNELADISSRFSGLKVFVISDTGTMVSFPSMSDQMLKKGVEELAATDIDKVYNDFQAQGFATLWNNYTNHQQSEHNVVWQGQEYRAFIKPFDQDVPEVHWNIAVMLPEESINEPFVQAVYNNIVSITIFMIALSISLWWIARRQLKPIQDLQKAMADISEGSADLTQRINIRREDEIGQLSKGFNVFVEKIQQLVKQSDNLAVQFKHDAETALSTTNEARLFIEDQKQQLDMVSAASVEMHQTSEHVAERAEDISAIASQSKSSLEQGVAMVNQATTKINDLAEHTETAADVVNQLADETKSIGDVVEVIRSIADQTNLLALNAAIEAARAGEQGRGFAVVADEVRGLASRTQESTGHIQEIVASLQAAANNASGVMASSQQEAIESKSYTEQINSTFDNMLNALTQLDEHMSDIASTVTEQSITAGQMNESIVGIDQLASNTVEQANKLTEQVMVTEKRSEELLNNLHKFKF